MRTVHYLVLLVGFIAACCTYVCTHVGVSFGFDVSIGMPVDGGGSGSGSGVSLTFPHM